MRNRNQKMVEDESVIGRIQIYYDKKEGETKIVSDSDGDNDEDLQEPEEAKHDFSQGEDQFLWYINIEKLYLHAKVLLIQISNFSFTKTLYILIIYYLGWHLRKMG